MKEPTFYYLAGGSASRGEVVTVFVYSDIGCTNMVQEVQAVTRVSVEYGQKVVVALLPIKERGYLKFQITEAK